LQRLGWQARITEVLSREIMLPAVGQGALGIEIRADDQRTRENVQSLNDPPSWSAVQAERAMLAALRAGCLAPVGAWGRVDPAGLRLDAVVLSRDGSQRITASSTGPWDDAPALGRRVAEQLLESGAAALIRTIREQS
jgi:hydroxymethylbilane synthase